MSGNPTVAVPFTEKRKTPGEVLVACMGPRALMVTLSARADPVRIRTESRTRKLRFIKGDPFHLDLPLPFLGVSSPHFLLTPHP
jgi:hypothetical protein